MSFITAQDSRHQGRPVILFSFNVGPSNYLRFVTADVVVNFDNGDGEGAQDYLPQGMKMDPVRQSGGLDKTQVKISLPQAADLAQRFLIYPPAQPVTVVVFHGHVGEADARLGFSGTVLACERDGGEAVMYCEPVISVLGRPGLQRNAQVGCPHVLFEGDCPASKAAVTTSHVAQAVGSASITLLAGWEGVLPTEKYLTGTVEWVNADGGTEVRMILRADATTVHLNGPVRDLDALDNVDVIAGCNRQRDDCGGIHNVINDYGGQDWIPNEDPYAVLNTFYGG